MHRAYRGSYELPEKWIFNDFGELAVRYYEDKNKNRKLDGNERLSGQMIHTTPRNEAQSDRFAGDPSKVALSESHGCIHIRPMDRREFSKQGAFRKGMTLIIHSYDEDFDPRRFQ